MGVAVTMGVVTTPTMMCRLGLGLGLGERGWWIRVGDRGGRGDGAG